MDLGDASTPYTPPRRPEDRPCEGAAASVCQRGSITGAKSPENTLVKSTSPPGSPSVGDAPIDSVSARTPSDQSIRRSTIWPLARGSSIIELFAGAGGLTLGLSQAGLAPDHIFEIDASCCETLRHNSKSPHPYISGHIHQVDIARVDWPHSIKGPVVLLAAGPPCQPFSRGGKHLADRDERNQFPALLRAVRALRPAVVLMENVPGILRKSFTNYLLYLKRQLENPSIAPLPAESWDSHDLRLAQHARSTDPEYVLACWTLNAADYGVAQARSRVFFVAVRNDVSLAVSPPQPTNSRDALCASQTNGSYWRAHGIPARNRTRWPARLTGDRRTPHLNCARWVTVRDVLAGLPDPGSVDLDSNNHWLIPGARLYRGHSGSELDWPAKTVKAGVHGVPGGENVVLLDDGTWRYFTLRELARLQGFPDDYFFTGPRSKVTSQVGNAVPRQMAYCVAKRVLPAIEAYQRNQRQELTFSPDGKRDARTTNGQSTSEIRP